MEFNSITEQVIGAAISVHRALGPGLLESAYEACMVVELVERGLAFDRQHPIPLIYKGARVDCGYRADFMIERKVIVELKSVERLEPIHEAQVLSYLRASGCPLGLLLNFNVRLLRDGMRRLVHDPTRRVSAPSATPR